MEAFVSMLPVLLHVSLFLFLAGLALFLVNVDAVIARVIEWFTIVTAIFYVLSLFMPLWSGACPSATPLLRLLIRLAEFAVETPRCTWAYLRREGDRVGNNLIQLRPAYHFDKIASIKSPLRTIEILDWMVSELPSTEEVDVALDAVGALELEKYRPFWNLTIEDVTDLIPPARRLGEAILNRADRADSLSGAELSLSIRSLVLIGTWWRFTWLPLPDAASRLYGRQRPKEYDAWPLYAAVGCTAPSPTTEQVSMIGQVGRHMMHWTAQGSQAPPMLPFTLECLFAMIESRDPHDTRWLTAISISEYAGLATCVLTVQNVRVLCAVVRDALVYAGVESRRLDLAAHLPKNMLEVWGAALDAADLLGFEPGDTDAVRRAQLATSSHFRTENVPSAWDEVLQRLSPGPGLSAGIVPWPDAVARATDLFCSGLTRRQGHWSFHAAGILHSLFHWHKMQSSDPCVLVTSMLDSIAEDHPEIAFGVLTCSSHSGSDSDVTDSLLNLLLPGEFFHGGRLDHLPDAGGTGSIWQLIVSSSSGKDQMNLVRAATSLVVGLRLFQSTQHSSERVAMLLSEICGAGRAVALVSHSKPAGAFDLARHIKDVSPDLWENSLRPALQQLQPYAWDVDWAVWWNGPEAFIQAVDEALPCGECTTWSTFLQRWPATLGPGAESVHVAAAHEGGELVPASDVRATSRPELTSADAGAERTTESPATPRAFSRHRSANIHTFDYTAQGSHPWGILQDDAIELESGQYALPIAGDVGGRRG